MKQALAEQDSAGGPRFVRRTSLRAGEYRKNFRQLDADIIDAVASREADEVTPLMSKIYLRLVSAPAEFWEREGVLYFSAGDEAGQPVKASKVLYGLLGVASATAHKALRWMHGQGIIGYFAGKNGAGIRIFLNRAAGSIGLRDAAAGRKILPFARGSNGEARGSANEPAFNDSYADIEVLEKDLNPRAPKSGAEAEAVEGKSSVTRPSVDNAVVEEMVERLKGKLEPCVREVAARAATQSAEREMVRTREWFESRALPKAVRVAQRETYELLRKHLEIGGGRGRGSASLEVGRSACSYKRSAACRLTPEEVRETAEVCVALLETQGKSIELTLSELSSERGGRLLPEDAPRVREAAQELALSWGRGGQG